MSAEGRKPDFTNITPDLEHFFANPILSRQVLIQSTTAPTFDQEGNLITDESLQELMKDMKTINDDHKERGIPHPFQFNDLGLGSIAIKAPSGLLRGQLEHRKNIRIIPDDHPQDVLSR